MSIVTRKGDQGTTALMYHRRVSKCDLRVEAYGAVDELNAALGLARASARNADLRRNLARIQGHLVVLMGELATTVDDLPRYLRDGYQRVSSDLTAVLDGLVAALEAADVTIRGWATPGANPASAALDFARTVCRRAERRACVVQGAGQLGNPEILVYLNRLSDLLWLFARWAEANRKTSHPKAIPRPPQSVLIASRLRTHSHPKAIPKPPQSHPKATSKRPQSSARRATRRRGR